MPASLLDIVTATRRTLPALRERRGALERAAFSSPVARPSFRSALRRERIAVVAEVKRRSPSLGVIREDLDPGDRAAAYARAGAAAVSVLTDGPFFGGSIGDLEAAARACAVPLLRKDFILDEVQVLEARVAGASAVLLLVRILEPARLTALLRYAAEVGLDALVEVHTMVELDRALESGAQVIGVNSRDLDSFAIDTAAAWKLLSRVPADRIAVAESGLFSRSDVLTASQAGADAVLVGTALSASTAPEQLLQDLAGVSRNGR